MEVIYTYHIAFGKGLFPHCVVMSLTEVQEVHTGEQNPLYHYIKNKSQSSSYDLKQNKSKNHPTPKKTHNLSVSSILNHVVSWWGKEHLSCSARTSASCGLVLMLLFFQLLKILEMKEMGSALWFCLM